MRTYVLPFSEIGSTDVSIAGGKGANLGELSRIAGIRVPEGFCVTTEVYKRTLGNTLEDLLDALAQCKAEEREKISGISARVRSVIEATPIPADIAAAITEALAEEDVYAVRSSATAEDLPTASFAGQQDSYLNITGCKAILQHIRLCWASLFTERAVTYRIQNGYDHRKVHLAVVVQKMVFAQAAGILFTADPVTSNRKVISIDAGFGLGDDLVSGRVNPDMYKVRDSQIIDKQVRQSRPVLTDEHILQLAEIGRTIEAHFGRPQDIEWCWADDAFHIVQSRPITTLYPIPGANDGKNHVYLSVGHQQMMTDPLKPLGLSMWRLTPMANAGGRLFVDVTSHLASPAGRETLLTNMGQHDPLMKDALTTLIGREDFIPLQPDEKKAPPTRTPAPIENDPAIVAELIGRSQAALDDVKRNIRTRSGVALFDFILEDIPEFRKQVFDPKSFNTFMAAINASFWVNEKMKEWLGESNVADVLSQSVPNNITSEMGLALLDVADAIRPYPAITEYLEQVKEDSFPEDLAGFDGGRQVQHAVHAYLDKYGMRCAGEIDITRTRWSERPAILIPMILTNIRNFEPGAGTRLFEEGRQEALQKKQELLERLAHLPDGEEKVRETKEKISLIRNFIGYREYPKYSIVSRYFVYKQALMKEAERLAQAGIIHEKEDVFYLSFEEFREVVRTHQVDRSLIGQRKEEYTLYEKLTPPRVITSDGEIMTGRYKRENLPADALAGLPVSAGVIEGRARVILQMEDANLEAGDILVTAFTDPSWTPLFVSIKGLVTEVGGLMTHGAVIAREYGLPAVVGVENATRLIRDGQRIRVNGTEGYVEFLSH